MINWYIAGNNMINKNEMQEFPPEDPRKINKEKPQNLKTLIEVAKLSIDKRNQYFVRFPRRVANALGLDEVDKIEFMVKISVPDAKPDDAKLTLRLIKK